MNKEREDVEKILRSKWFREKEKKMIKELIMRNNPLMIPRRVIMNMKNERKKINALIKRYNIKMGGFNLSTEKDPLKDISTDLIYFSDHIISNGEEAFKRWKQSKRFKFADDFLSKKVDALSLYCSAIIQYEAPYESAKNKFETLIKLKYKK